MGKIWLGPEETVIFLAVLALATDVSIFRSGIRQNSCLSNELQDFWQSPLRFDSAIHHHLIPRGLNMLRFKEVPFTDKGSLQSRIF